MPNPTARKFGFPETLIREYDHWVVLLREQQVTLASLVLCAKSDATRFSALPGEAFAEMGVVVGDTERALAAALRYDKINYLMLMMVDPNVHFHVFPRYESERTAGGLTMTDAGWPGPPAVDAPRQLSAVERDALVRHIKGYW